MSEKNHRLAKRLRIVRTLALCALVALCCPSLPAQTAAFNTQPADTATRAVARPGSTSSAVLPDYIVGPEDLLTVQVYDAPDITGDYRVSSTGQIELPLLPQAIVAAGLTPAQLSQRIGEQYQKAEIVSHPRVTVSLKEPRVHSITIAGAVKSPQIYSTDGTTTVMDAISQGGGLADDASTTATVTRGDMALRALKQSGVCDAAGGQAPCAPSFPVDLKQLMEAGDPALNVALYPGDRVDVQHAGIVYVIGAVNRPGGFPLKAGQDDMTLIWALALAQDFTLTASKTKAMIIRKNPAEKNGRQEIPVNMKQVLAGKNDDLKLQANDILYVEDSTAKRALHHGADVAVQAASFGLIYHW